MNRLLTWGLFIVALAPAHAVGAPPGGGLEPGGFDHVVALEIGATGPGRLSGTLHNHGQLEIRDIAVLVRHAWVWPYSGRDLPDTSVRSEIVRIPGPLEAGQRAAFSSVVETPGDLPLDATYVGRARVVELTEMHPRSRQ